MESLAVAMIVVDKGRRTLSLVANGGKVVCFPVLVGQEPGSKRREGGYADPRRLSVRFRSFAG